VDQLVDEPLDLRRLEYEDDLCRGQVDAVAVKAELCQVERRPVAQQLLGLGMLAVLQASHDHQTVHRSSFVVCTSVARSACARIGRTPDGVTAFPQSGGRT